MADRADGVRRGHVGELRCSALSGTVHARTPEIIANLQIGFEAYIQFAYDCGAIDASERDFLNDRCWTALQQASAEQNKHHAATEPTVLYLATVRSLLVSGRAHLESRNGGEPEHDPRCYGWRFDAPRWCPQGDCIGWIDGDDIYLEPAATFRLVQLAGRDGGETVAISASTLNRRLKEKGRLASVDEARQTVTVRKTVGGSSRSVLHFSRDTVLPDVEESTQPERDE